MSVIYFFSAAIQLTMAVSGIEVISPVSVSTRKR